MNSGSYAVASRHGEPKTIPKRRFRRRVGLFVAPYLALVREDAPQRNHELREVFKRLRWIVRTGSARAICHTIFRRRRLSTSR